MALSGLKLKCLIKIERFKGDNMKIKLSRSQWEKMGKTAGWMGDKGLNKSAQGNTQGTFGTQEEERADYQRNQQPGQSSGKAAPAYGATTKIDQIASIVNSYKGKQISEMDAIARIRTIVMSA